MIIIKSFKRKIVSSTFQNEILGPKLVAFEDLHALEDFYKNFVPNVEKILGLDLKKLVNVELTTYN